MNRLLINPGTPQAWEIPLQPGTNRIGRIDEDNDFAIPHSSVSSHHCEVIVTDDGAYLRDLGSTNGSFVNRARLAGDPVKLQTGQHIQLGSVDMTFEGAVATAPVVAKPAPPGLQIRIHAPAAQPVAATTSTSDSDIPLPPPPTQGLHVAHAPVAPPAMTHGHAPSGTAPMMEVRDKFCKSHGKSPARFHCGHCNMFFCDLCVGTRATAGTVSHSCRHCGKECVPVRVRVTPKKTDTQGFFQRLPGAFGYPFKGTGIFLLVGGSVMYVLLHFCPIMLIIGNLWMKAWGLIGTLVIGGYLAAFLQSIIHTTATGDEELPSMPSVTNVWDDVLLPAFQFSGVFFACFGPAFILRISAAVSESTAAALMFWPVLLLGCAYFPMGYLAVVLLDSIKALNPMLIFQSVRNVPLEYLATLGLLAVVAVFGTLGDRVMMAVFAQGLMTTDIKKFFLMVGLVLALIFFGFYLITVSTRVLGLLYVTKKNKLGWYD